MAGGLLFPLDAIYARAGVRPPTARRIAAGSIPIAYRSLLVHEGGMTATLEHHVGGRVDLRILSSHMSGAWYVRRVLLVNARTGRPLTMGAVRVKLNAFSSRVRGRILRGAVPIGRILRNGGADYASRPRAFLAVTPNAEMMGVFWMPKPRTLFGRRTEMFHDGRAIGDIVEVLPIES